MLYQFLAIPPRRRRAQRTRGERSGYPSSSSATRRHRPRLKLLIPDTLVFNVEDEPQWYYTDKDGHVACMARYEPGQAVEQFGDIRFDDDLVAVRKQSCLLPLSGLREGEDQAAVYSTGNTLSLVNTKDLRVITGASIGTDGGKAAGAVIEGSGPFVVQKFVKSKGPHAFIVRQTVERCLPPTAWMISNRQPYGEEIDHPDSLLLAGPQLLGRFTTTPLARKRGRASGSTSANPAAHAGCCNITRLGPGACVETAEAAGRIKRHLEVVLDRRLQMLVADFTRDDRDRLWFLQVKAFRFMGFAPRRPFQLTAMVKDKARARLRGENPSAEGASTVGKSASPTRSGANPAAKRPTSSGGAADVTRGGEGSDSDIGGSGDCGARRTHRGKRASFGMNAVKKKPHGAGLGPDADVFGEQGLGLGGDWEAAAEAAVAAAACGEGGSGGGGRKSERKKLACGVCGAMRTPEDVSFRMTAKMVRETLFHIWGRLPPAQVPRSLRITDGKTHAGVATAAAAAFIARKAAENSHPHSSPTFGPTTTGKSGRGTTQNKMGASLSSPTTAVAPSASVAYDNVRACEACFTLHQIEAALVRAERRLAAAVGGSARAPGRGNSGWKGQGSGIGPASRRRINENEGRGAEAKGRGSWESFGDGFDSLVPANRLSLCRILVAVTEILDVPRTFLEEAAARSRSLQLQYELLGQREVIHLGNPVAAGTRETRVGGGGTDRRYTGQRTAAEGGGGRLRGHEDMGGLLVPITVNHFRVFSFLAADTPLKGELPRGSGLDDFLTWQREVVMTLSLAPTAKTSKRGRHQQPRGGEPPWLASGWAGEAKLGLRQFRNDHVQKVELQAPLLLSGGGGSGRQREDERTQMLLVKAILGLERVRSGVNISILARPPSFHRGVYVFDGDSVVAPEDKEAEGSGGGDGYRTGDPLPEAWMEIESSQPGTRFSGLSPTRAGRGNKNGDNSRPWSSATRPTSPTPSDAMQSHHPASEEQPDSEEDPASVWGLCLCIAGVHRPGGMAVVRERRELQLQQQQQRELQLRQQQQQQQQQQHRPNPEPEPVATMTLRQRQANAISEHSNSALTTASVQTPSTTWAEALPTGTEVSTSTAIPAPTPIDPRGWQPSRRMRGAAVYPSEVWKHTPICSAAFRDYGSFFTETGVGRVAALVVVALVMVVHMRSMMVVEAVGVCLLWSYCIAVALVERMGMDKANAGTVCDATARCPSRA
eukprot:g13482.t1